MDSAESIKPSAVRVTLSALIETDMSSVDRMKVLVNLTGSFDERDG